MTVTATEVLGIEKYKTEINLDLMRASVITIDKDDEAALRQVRVDQAGSIIKLTGAGCTVTLPVVTADHVGLRFTFILDDSGNKTINTGQSADKIQGFCYMGAQNSTAETKVGSNANGIAMTAVAKGNQENGILRFTVIEDGLFHVDATLVTSGSTITSPFN